MSSVVDSSSHATLQKRSTASVHEKVKVTQAKRRLPKRTVPLESFNSGQLAEIMFNSFELVRGYKLGGIQFNWCQVICFAVSIRGVCSFPSPTLLSLSCLFCYSLHLKAFNFSQADHT